MSPISKRKVEKVADSQYKNVTSGDIYQGVNSIIEKYKQPVDWEAVAIQYAEKHGKTAEYWLSFWKSKHDHRKMIGNMFHNIRESGQAGASVGASKTGKILEVRNHNLLLDTGIDIANLPDGIYLELPLYHHGFGVSGTPDKIVIETDKETGIRYVDVDDYKTSSRIDEESYQYKRSGNFKMMQFPLHMLMDCNLVHFSIQTTMYAYMLECFGFTPRNITISHFNYVTKEDEEDIVQAILELNDENVKFDKEYVVDYEEYKTHVINLLTYEFKKRRAAEKNSGS